MKKNYFLLLLTALLTVVACEYNESVVLATTEKQQDEILDGKIPLNRAISNADFVFKNMEDLGRKNRKIKSVDVLTKSKANTRVSRSSSQDEENALAYVVNYENNEGFAILAADIKLPPVISIGDEGNFDTEGFVNFIQHNGATRSNEEINPAQEIQYAVVSNSLLLPPVGGGLGNKFTQGVDTTIMFKCSPLVKTKWGQDDPYNYYADPDPHDPDLISKAGCVPVAEAQTLAALCYHHNWRPTTQLSEEYGVSWYNINRMIFSKIFEFLPGDYSSNALEAASLIRAIGEVANAQYSHDETGVYTFNIPKPYQKVGLQNIRFGNSNPFNPVDRNDIFTMIISKNLPVNARAENSLTGGKSGHCFILDGWLRLEYSLLQYEAIEIFVGETTLRQTNVQRNFDLVHINLGWKGWCDGYYLPDAFDLTQNKYEEYAEDNDDSGTSQHVYNLDVAYLVYDLQ